MPDGTGATIPTEHAAVLYVNEPCPPQLLPQSLGLLTAPPQNNKSPTNIYLNNSCCTDNVALGTGGSARSPLRVGCRNLQPEWVDALRRRHERGPLATQELLCCTRAASSVPARTSDATMRWTRPWAQNKRIWCAKPSGRRSGTGRVELAAEYGLQFVCGQETPLIQNIITVLVRPLSSLSDNILTKRPFRLLQQAERSFSCLLSDGRPKTGEVITWSGQPTRLRPFRCGASGAPTTQPWDAATVAMAVGLIAMQHAHHGCRHPAAGVGGGCSHLRHQRSVPARQRQLSRGGLSEGLPERCAGCCDP